MIFVFPWFLDLIAQLIPGDPFTNSEVANTGLAIFHTAFNLANVLIMIWFAPFLVKLAIKTVKSRGDIDEVYRLEYIEGAMMSTPELSIMEAKKEISKFGTIIKKQTGFVRDLLVETDKKKFEKLLERTRKYEQITDRIEEEVAIYLTKIAKGEMSEETSIQVRGMLNMVSDMERIGDINYQMSKMIERKKEQKIWFAPEQREKIMEFLDLLDKAYDNMNNNLNTEYDSVSIQKAIELERSINRFRNEMLKKYLRSVEKGEYNIDNGIVYKDLFSSIEKIGDHIINVNEGIVGEV